MQFTKRKFLKKTLNFSQISLILWGGVTPSPVFSTKMDDKEPSQEIGYWFGHYKTVFNDLEIIHTPDSILLLCNGKINRYTTQQKGKCGVALLKWANQVFEPQIDLFINVSQQDFEEQLKKNHLIWAPKEKKD